MDKAEVLSTVRKLFVTAAFMLLASLSALADEVSKTVTLTEEGTLSNYINESEQTTITNLTVSGPINYVDVNLMETMAKKGQLSILDMSGATTTNGELIKQYCFYGSKLVSVSLPSGVQWIKNQAFENCTDLKSVTIPSGALEVQGDVFKGCI